MAEPVLKYGARKGAMTAVRRQIAKASSRDICVFPVPGADVLRLYMAQTDMDARLAANPREANVLLVMGKLPDPLARKAGIAFQQIPRPRVLLVAGSEEYSYLPEPDIRVQLKEGFLTQALSEARILLQEHAWSEEAQPWEPEFLTEIVEDSDEEGSHDHHHHGHDHGDDKDDHQGHHHHDADDSQEEENNHNHGDENGHGHSHEDHDEEGGHDHDDMDFMSMVEMTKDLPRPKDGLPMNRSEVHFGPFHPGLPGGLSVWIELDGDTVVKASIENYAALRLLHDSLPVSKREFADAFSRINPLTPKTYRLLATKALENAFGGDGVISYEAVAALEKERVESHLNWLATFAKTVGNEWMHQKAARWHALHRNEELSFGRLREFLEQIQSMPYLREKLSVRVKIPDRLLHHITGPAAKAAGKTEDARSNLEAYRFLGWAPFTTDLNNAWGRLQVRLHEIKQSVELIEKARDKAIESKEIDEGNSGTGVAILESPRGRLKLDITVKEGSVHNMKLNAPSKPLAALVPTLTEEMELSDALVQVASLDIAPWEMEIEKDGEEE